VPKKVKPEQKLAQYSKAIEVEEVDNDGNTLVLEST